MAIRHWQGKESGIRKGVKAADLLELLQFPLGQHYPTHCPTEPAAPGGQPVAPGAESRLGRALDIRQVARLIGCSPWNVRQRLIPRGLPHFRSGASSKLIFYEAQVVRWIEQKQKGG